MRCDAATIEQVHRRFRRDIWSVAPLDAVVETGLEIESFGPIMASVFRSFPEERRLQLIQGAAEPGAVKDGHLAAAIDWMRERDVDFLIPVTAERPESRRAEEWLNWRGFEQAAVVGQYARSTAAPPEPEAGGAEVLELYPDEGEGMAEIAAAELGLPVIAGVVLFNGLPGLDGWRCYVALLDGVLAGCGAMLISRGIAVLGIDGTLPPARGRGCSRALLCRRIRDAAAAGCHTVLASGAGAVTAGSSETARNLLSTGFEEIGRSVNWRSPLG